MLRVTDQLMENLITEVMERDSKADFTKRRGEEKGLYLKKLIKDINGTGITFNVWKKMRTVREMACMIGQVWWGQTKRS